MAARIVAGSVPSARRQRPSVRRELPSEPDRFELAVLSSGDVIAGGLTREEARAKARVMNSIAAGESELVIWRPDRSQVLQARPVTVTIAHGYLVSAAPAPSRPPEEPAPLSDRPDEDLLQAWQHGDHDAFAELHRRYSPIIRNYIAKRTRQPNAADGLCQETFLTLSRSRRRFLPGEFRPWLFRVARNQYCNFIRNRIVERQAHDESCRIAEEKACENENTNPPLDDLVAAEQLDWVRVAVAQLPNDKMELLRLRFKDDLRWKEIGDIYSTSDKAMQVRVTKALKVLTWFLATTRRRLSFLVTQVGTRLSGWNDDRPTTRVDWSQRLGLVQLAILRIALRNRLTGTSAAAETSGAEILHEYYGFPYASDRRGEVRPFDIQAIGELKWKYATEALRYATRQLERRGLADVERTDVGTVDGIAGITLTEAGVTMQLELVDEAVQPC